MFAGYSNTMELRLLYAILWLFAVVIWRPVASDGKNSYSESKAREFLHKANQVSAQEVNKVIVADWNWSSNLTDENSKIKVLNYIFLSKSNVDKKCICCPSINIFHIF